MFDLLNEILSSLKKNKLRTFLTGFSMAWGIFILIVLLGAGNGLKNGIQSNYGSSNMNISQMWPGRTSVAYQGLQVGRRIKFDGTDGPYMQKEIQNIAAYSVTNTKYGGNIVYGKEYVSAALQGCDLNYPKINYMFIVKGRNINQMDLDQIRKVIVLHKRTADILFKGEEPLGKYVIINKISFQVVGIYSDDDMSQRPVALIPLSTSDKIYNSAKNGYSALGFLIDDLSGNIDDINSFDWDVKSKMGLKKQFKPEDNSALYYYSTWKDYNQTQGLFGGITLFIWIIGIGTLIAGIVGISNIMLITVKERTKEFGIRKSLGAKPTSIITLILSECLMITACFGYVGMFLGMGVVEIMNLMTKQPGGEVARNNMVTFLNPSVDLGIVISATIVLIIAGLIAGYIPAKKAVIIKPIEALRYE